MQRPLSIYIPLIPNWLSLGKMNLKKKKKKKKKEREREAERRDMVADYGEASSYI